jgi:DnaJ-class molecular chaperone
VAVFLVRSFIKCDNDYLLFVLFARGGGSSRGRWQRRGEDVVHPLKVSLDDLYNGTLKSSLFHAMSSSPSARG